MKGEDFNPSQSPFDPELVMLSGDGRRHGSVAIGMDSYVVLEVSQDQEVPDEVSSRDEASTTANGARYQG